MTDEGPLPIEWLSTGDKLWTRDGGYQPILWMDRTRLSMAELRELPQLAPVELPESLVAPDQPHHKVRVSPSQLVFFTRRPGDANCGGVLIEANMLEPSVNPMDRRNSDEVVYVSILLPAHHLIQVEGLWMGSLFLADLAADLEETDRLRAGLDAPVMEPVAPILDRNDALNFLTQRNQFTAYKRA